MAEVATTPEPQQFAARFFVPVQGPSTRRPVHVLVVAAGLLLTGLAVRAAESGSRLEETLLRLPSQLPSTVVAIFDATYLVGAGYAVVIAAGVLATIGRRGRLPLALAAAGALAFGGTLLVSVLAGEGWPDLAPQHSAVLAGETFPTVRVAVVAAVLLVVAPWLVTTYRRLNALVVTVLCVAAWVIGVAGPADVLGALGVGATAAGITLVAFGSPGGHPTLDRVVAHVRALGIELYELAFAPTQPWGVRLLHGRTVDGRLLLVKVYGRDAADAHRAARWWRALLYRDRTAPDATRLQLVEHEALVTILAERAGVRVTRVLAAATAQGDAVLVLEAPPPSLEDLLDHRALDDEALRAVWTSLARLRSAGLAHGGLTLERISLDTGGAPVFADFTEGSVAADPVRLAADVATLLTALALRCGTGRTVDAALDVLGPEPLVEAQPYLQIAALPRALRAAPRTSPGVKQTLGELRELVAGRTGTEPPPPAPIRRMTWRDLVQTGLLLVAAYALLSMLIQLDWQTVIDTWANATWAWVALGIVVAQVTAPVDAVSTMATVTSRLPLLPLTQLQYAIKLVGLAVSATAGRAAMNASFFKRFGEGPSAAVTATALDSFAAAVCNVVVVLLAVLLADDVPRVPLDGPDDLTGLLVALVLALVVSVLVVVLVPAVRRSVVRAVQGLAASFRVVTTSPARALVLFGSNLVSLLITAVAMDCMVEGLQPSLDYTTVLAVTAGASLFASVIPVPGNVGVAEAAISAGLVLVGVPSGPAFAIAVTQRIATSYLPPLYGVWALRWLRREDYVG